jgi:predicted metalloprotease with PDZ domain
MIGRNPKKKVEVLGDAFATEIAAVTDRASADLDLPLEWSGLNYSAASDHHSFHKRFVPSMFFFTGTHADYHQPGDHADKLSYERMEKLARLGFRVAGAFAAAEATPRYIHQILWLGAGIQMTDGRALITSVVPDSRGHRAGLHKGDVLVRIGDQVIASGNDLKSAFDSMMPGAKSPAELRRSGKKVAIEIERAKQGFLGVMPGEVSDEQRKKFGLAADEGLILHGVTADSPADKAKLQAGDILIRLGGEPINLRRLSLRLATLGAGETVTATVVRNGERLQLPITLGARPE